MPTSIHDFLARYVRYTTHVTAYVVLAAGPYPGFGGSTPYPVDVEIDPPERQRRLGGLVRLLLVLPASLLAWSLGGSAGLGLWSGVAALALVGGLTGTIALLGWFACLARGRMPRGMRDAAAYGCGYAAQVTAYALLLTGRYPDSAPDRIGAARRAARPPRRGARRRRPAPASPARPLPPPARHPTPLLADALGRTRGRRSRLCVARGDRAGPRPPLPAPVPRGVPPRHGAPERLRLRRRAPVPRLRRPRGQLSARLHDRTARTAASSRRARRGRCSRSRPSCSIRRTAGCSSSWPSSAGSRRS